MKKKLLLILIIPILLYSKNQTYQDTVTTNEGRIIPCTVVKLDNEKISLKYDGNEYPSGTGLTYIDKIVLDEKGTIYVKKDGFLLDINSIKKYISKRNVFLVRQERELEKVEKKKQFSKNMSKLNGKKGKSKYEIEKLNNRWSFGIFYIPLYSSSLYYYNSNHNYYYDGAMIIQILNLSMIESHFSYKLSSKVNIILDLGYSNSYTKEKNERHKDYYDYNYNDYDQGTIETDDIKIFVANIGFKIYLKQLRNKKVSPFLQFGIGKQLASITDDSKDLFDDNSSSTTTEDNIDEFNKKLNSPLNANCGFGVEYSFNESLSLFSSVRLYYAEIDADYDYRYIGKDYTENRIKEIDNTEINTRIGLGLNFYF